MIKVNVREKLALFSDYWNPRIVAELNGQHVKLAKFQGEFVWHDHPEEDEMFLVIRGRFRMEFRDHSVSLSEGEFLIVPRGVEHRQSCFSNRPRSNTRAMSSRTSRFANSNGFEYSARLLAPATDRSPSFSGSLVTAGPPMPA